MSTQELGRQRLGIALTGFAVLTFLAFLALQLHLWRDREQDFAFRDSENLTRVLERHLTATFAKIDLALSLVVSEHGAALASGQTGSRNINAMLADVLQRIPESQSLRVVNAQGRVVHDASGTLPRVDVSDRAYFIRNRDDPKAGLVISEPIFARITNNWVVTVSRRISDAEGNFAGLIQAAVRADALQDFYKTLDVGQTGTISLYNNELLLFARHPALPDAMGQRLQNSRIEQLLAQGLNSANYVAVSPIDKIERTYSFRKLQGLPFVVLVGRAQSEIFASWRVTAWLFLAVAIALVVTVGLMLRNWRRLYGQARTLAEQMAANWQETLQRTRALLDSLPDPAWLKDHAGRMIAVNDAYCQLTNQPMHALIGKTVFDIWPHAEAQAFHLADQRVLQSQIQVRAESLLQTWDGRERYLEFIRTPARDEAGNIIGIAGIARDLTERKQAEDRIRHLAEHDPLTNLPNRALLHSRLASTLADSVGDQLQIALLFLDLDHFKNINDSLGHDIGDQLLLQVAERLKACLHERDTVSRQGGDEFAVLLLHCNSPAMIALIAQRLIDAISHPFAVEGHEFTIGASIGIAIFPQDGAEISTLMKNADAAMYHAKSAGRGQYQFFSQDMNTRVFERLSLETNLRKALKFLEFELYYQPQVEAGSGRIGGVEALIRWRHPELGMVSPTRFIPIAEDTNLILPIGSWVLQAACRQAMAWQAAGLPPLRVSVNLSLVQFRQHRLAQDIAQVLESTGLDPRWLELEITESTLMTDSSRVIDTLKDLKELGISIAIDDFGTGYSSLSYLKRFPIDKIKIDQSFVRDVHRDPDNAAITQAIIGIAGSLHMAVVAEGVETAEECAFLLGQGCQQMQGYHFSRPIEADTLETLLALPQPFPPAQPVPGTKR